jgi:hypothetical protein
MLWKRKGGIKPYGYDWNSDRSAVDYDPRRDPYVPGSPVFGQWPRYPWLRQALKQPILWALVAWFVTGLSLLALYALGVISNETFFAGYFGRYLLLFAG